MKLCSPGEPGELCISGLGVGSGYYNRPELTSEKFINNIFATDDEKEKGFDRLYKTGDLANWLPDGNISIVGRIDFQVKIRGFRVELGEIETKLVAIQSLKNAAVLAHSDTFGNKYLCAYYEADAQIDKGIIKKQLISVLPDYMVPNTYIYMNQFPLTPNGKIDRKSLPIPDLSAELKQNYIAPANEKEQFITDIWQKVLDIKRIGTNDNFFELGGHSLKAAQIINLINEAGYSFELKDLTTHKTIKEISLIIGQKSQKNKSTKIHRIDRNKTWYNITKTQQEIWCLDKLDETKRSHNILFRCDFTKEIDNKLLERTLNIIFEHYEGFHSVFCEKRRNSCTKDTEISA